MRKEAVVTKVKDLFRDMPGKYLIRIADIIAEMQTRNLRT
jgi:hypothetical protein